MTEVGNDGFGDATAEALAELGASNREIEIYKVLVGAPGVSPRELGVQTGQSRGRIYETLRDMARRGLVREEPSHPTRFVAVPPRELVAVALSGTDRRRNLLALAAKAFGVSLSLDPKRGPSPRAAKYSLVRGRVATMRELADLVDLAADHVDIVGTDRLLARIARHGRLLQAIRAAVGRGRRVTVAGPPSLEGEADAARLRSLCPGAQVVTLGPDAKEPVCVATNGLATVISVVDPPDIEANRGNDEGIRVESSRFAAILGVQLDVALRPEHRDATADGDGTANASVRFLLAANGANTEILGMGPKGWAGLVAGDGESLLHVFATALRRGVRLRAVTEADPESASLLRRFAESWDVRICPFVPSWTVVIDRRFLFEAFAAEHPGSPPFLRMTEQRDEVRHACSLFESLWGTGAPLASVVPQQAAHGQNGLRSLAPGVLEARGAGGAHGPT